MSQNNTVNQTGIDLIKSFESCSLVAYQDQGGVWTIAWGLTVGVKEGMTCTQAQADSWLVSNIGYVADILNRSVPAMNSNQFSACVSLAYNIGTGNFHQSTLLKCLNAGDFSGASDQFLVWVKIKGVPNDGLLRRRQAEQALFKTAISA